MSHFPSKLYIFFLTERLTAYAICNSQTGKPSQASLCFVPTPGKHAMGGVFFSYRFLNLSFPGAPLKKAHHTRKTNPPRSPPSTPIAAASGKSGGIPNLTRSVRMTIRAPVFSRGIRFLEVFWACMLGWIWKYNLRCF